MTNQDGEGGEYLEDDVRVRRGAGGDVWREECPRHALRDARFEPHLRHRNRISCLEIGTKGVVNVAGNEYARAWGRGPQTA